MIFKVEKEVWEKFPGMKIVAVVCNGISACKDKAGLSEYLNSAWKIAGAAATEFENPQSHPYIKAWGDAMKEVGAPRKKFPSSIEAMVRRAGKDENPFRISPIVDFYNAVSLKNLVPAGGYDMDEIKQAIELRFSKAGDSFCALDEGEATPVPAGEVSYADSDIVITRHFVWRQSKHCLLNANTKNVLFVSEILGELPADTADKVAADLTEGLEKFFGVKCNAVIMDINNSEI